MHEVEKDFTNFAIDLKLTLNHYLFFDIINMKKIVFTLLMVLTLSTQIVKAEPDIRDLLGGLAGGMTGNTSSDDSQSSSALGDALGGLISGLLGSGQLSEADLAGVYQYNEPAITFKSDNLLQKAGGAAMAATIVEKLAPYYERAGMKNLVVTLTPEKEFQFTIGRIKLSGTFMRDSAQTSSNSFIFTFTALGRVGLGNVAADVQLTGNNLIITFDASKLLSLVNTIAQFSGKESLKTAASFLNSYDGLNCGFSLTKTADVAPSETSTTTTPTKTDASSSLSKSEAIKNLVTPTDSTTSTSNGLGNLLNMLKNRQ